MIPVGPRPVFLVFLGFFAVQAACSRPADSERGTAPRPPAAAATPAPSASSRAPSAPVDESAPRIIFLGDSLTAGLGVDVEQSFPSLIQERLTRENYRY